MTDDERNAVYENYYFEWFDIAVKCYDEAKVSEDEKTVNLKLEQAIKIWGNLKLIDIALSKQDITTYEAIKLLAKINKMYQINEGLNSGTTGLA